ncbi:MAG TPA: hypothetical protein VF111_00450, partial [Thermoanaerobaculia bacterium]
MIVVALEVSIVAVAGVYRVPVISIAFPHEPPSLASNVTLGTGEFAETGVSPVVCFVATVGAVVVPTTRITYSCRPPFSKNPFTEYGRN